MKVGDLCRFRINTIREDAGDLVLILERKEYGHNVVYIYLHQKTGQRRQAAQRYLEKVNESR